MIITLSVIGLALLFLILCIVDDFCNEGLLIGLIVFGILAALILVAWPINYMTEVANIERFHSLEQTLLNARANDNVSEYEIAAITQTVAEMNKDLASHQYWAAHPLTSWFYPKEILTLEPIR